MCEIGASLTYLFADLLRLGTRTGGASSSAASATALGRLRRAPSRARSSGSRFSTSGGSILPPSSPVSCPAWWATSFAGSRAPVPALHGGSSASVRSGLVGLSLVSGAVFGIVALLLIEAIAGRPLPAALPGRALFRRRGRGSLPRRSLALAGDASRARRPDDRGRLAGTGTIAPICVPLEESCDVRHAREGGIAGSLPRSSSSGRRAAPRGAAPSSSSGCSRPSASSASSPAGRTPIAAAVMGIELLPVVGL